VARRRGAFRGPVIDVHTHPQLGNEIEVGTKPHRPEDYLAAMRGVDLRRIAALVIAPRGDPTRTRRLNDSVLDLGARSSGRFFPVCSVHPLDGDEALEEVDRVARAGARALKLHPNTQDFDVADPAIRGVVKRASEGSLPVLFDAYSPFDPAQAGKFVRLAMEVPDARLILAHAHGPRFPDLLVHPILALYPWWRRRVWVDLSATGELLAGGPFAEQFVWVLRKVGVDRLLFGSDFPLSSSPRGALDALIDLGFRPEEIRAVAHDNAAELFGFVPAGGSS
jgi:predicted TIM-barrel fold metal-dependent hydrolase